METQIQAVNPLIQKRHSPRSFSNKPVEQEKLTILFDAARWAASSYNGQPWHFVVAQKSNPEAWQRIFDCLNPWNQKWAGGADVLMMVCARNTFEHNGSPNKHSWYDTGAAMANLSLQAAELDLYLHQMGGYSREQAAEKLNIPEGFESICTVALGYKGDGSELPEELAAKENAPRSRKAIEEFVHQEVW